MNHPVLANLRRRAQTSSTAHPPATVTGLVVEGGGMRGVYSIGVLEVLQEAGLAGAFDHVFGASTGALNGSCLVAAQCRQAREGYLDAAATPQFINWLRWRRVVDLDYLIDDIIGPHRAELEAGLSAARSVVHAVLTEVTTRTAHVITSHERDVHWIEVLRATMALPVLYGQPVALRGKHYMDGCIVDPIPLQRAIGAGCTDILVVMTRPPGFRVEFGTLTQLFERVVMRQFTHELRARARADRAAFNATMERIDGYDPGQPGVRLHAIHPSDPRRMVTATTVNHRRLVDCLAMARADAERWLRDDAP